MAIIVDRDTRLVVQGLTGSEGRFHGLRNRNYVGIDRILWESEFPRSASTYPDSTRMIESNFAEVPVNDRELILWRNAARLYKLSI